MASRATKVDCPDCGATGIPGGDRSGGHCRGGRYGGCCQSFRSLAAFERHRVRTDTPGHRRCLTPAEMLEKGWSVKDGLWRLPAPAKPFWPAPGSPAGSEPAPG